MKNINKIFSALQSLKEEGFELSDITKQIMKKLGKDNTLSIEDDAHVSPSFSALEYCRNFMEAKRVREYLEKA
jgi:hypothetical protein